MSETMNENRESLESNGVDILLCPEQNYDRQKSVTISYIKTGQKK